MTALFVLPFVGLAVPQAAAAQAGDSVLELNLVLSVGSLDRDWEPVDRPIAVTFQTTWGRRKRPVLFAADLVYANDAACWVFPPDIESEILELDLGVRKMAFKKSTRAFVGGGATFARAKQKGADIVNDSDFGVGAWIDGGVYWYIDRTFNFGFEARWSTVEVDLVGQSRNAGALYLGVLIGFGSD
jgi:hypothetical protein